MRNLSIIVLVSLVLFGCSGKPSGGTKVENQVVETVYTVDELYSNASALVDKEVKVKGTVMHVCKEGGARCFIMGSADSITLRVEAGETIGAFTQEQKGSELEISGILKVVKTEADAHNTKHDEGNEEKPDSTRQKEHKIISESQENADIVYFLQGIKINNK